MHRFALRADPMWKYAERTMAVVGFIATVAGTIIGYYALVSPADLSNNLAAIADRLAKEPVLEERERLFIGQVLESSPGLMIYAVKETTSASGSMVLTVCDSVAKSEIGRAMFSFGRESAEFYPTFPRRSEALTIRINATIGGQTLFREEEWRLDNTNWARTAVPRISETSPAACS